MKRPTRVLYTLFIGIFSIAMIMTACSKEEETITPTPTPTPTSVQNYTGATSDYGAPVGFTTADIDGEKWVTAYSIDAKYVNPLTSQSYEQTFSSSSNTGLVKFNSNAISLDTGTGLILNGTLQEDGKYLNGQYTYNYLGVLSHTGNFTTDKQ